MKETLSPAGKVIVKVRHYDSDTGEYSPWELRTDPIGNKNLLTTAGIDRISKQVYGTSGDSVTMAWIALTTDSTAPAAADTQLSAEATTGGLSRAVSTYAHTAGQATLTLTKTFTATAQHTAVQKAGVLSSSSGGTLIHENTFSSTNLLTNDQLAVTWTITLSG